MPAPVSPSPVSSARRNWFAWMAALVFVAAIVSVPIASRTSRRRPTSADFHIADELIAFLGKHGLRLQVVAGPNPKECFLCDQSHSIQELSGLFLEPRKMERWRGVVVIKQQGVHFLLNKRELDSWGECGMQVGDLYLFGHPDLLAKIRMTLSLKAED